VPCETSIAIIMSEPPSRFLVSRVEFPMRSFALSLVVLAGCSPAPENASTPPPTGTPPAVALLSEPAADSRLLGRLFTVGDMSRLTPVTEVEIARGLDADWAEKNGAARVTPDDLGRLLAAGRPVAPDDKRIDGWSYAPWCQATFVGGGRKWSVALYLGRLGVISDDAGRRGVFRFGVPGPDDGE
jgi:hypothetical protein